MIFDLGALQYLGDWGVLLILMIACDGVWEFCLVQY